MEKHARLKRAVFLCTLILALPPTAWCRIIYVDADAKGKNNGSSWIDACVSLESGLMYARWATKPIEVRVAQGVYKPSPDSGGSFGGLPDELKSEMKRQASFKLSSGISLKGGYAGLGAEDPDARDIVASRTILSGDHRGDDIEMSRSMLTDSPSAPALSNLRQRANRNDNSMRVVVATDVDDTAVLDGFTITGGSHNATGREIPIGGAGLNNYKGSPTVIDCTFVDNCVADVGGAVYNHGVGNPRFIRCTFQNNYAWDGGGMFTLESDPVLIDCRFIGNYARARGAGIFSQKRNPYAGIFGPPTTGSGDGVSSQESNLALTNCTFTGNVAESRGVGSTGAAVYNQSSCNPVMTNCLFTGNVNFEGAVIYNDLGSRAVLNGCILWDNHGPIMTSKTGSSAEVLYSNIQGGWPGEGNIDADPRFARTGLWTDPNDPSLPRHPSDLNAIWVDGDYHLKSQAGRWDAESQRWVVDDVTSPCIDAGDPNSPIGEEPEPNGGRINMGAYGGTAEASKSYVPHVIYVDASAAGANDGSSWANAYHYLQDALADAATAEKPVEVRVAQGVYRPDRGAGIQPGDVKATFQMCNGVAIRGGYAGLGQADPNALDPSLYETILWGDLADNDDPAVESTFQDNSRHVVTSSGVDESAVLEGVIITRGAYIVPFRGEADALPRDPEGGAGIYNVSGSPTIVHCTFTQNLGKRAHGAGMLNWRGSAPRLRNCTFRGNLGIALCSIGSAPVLTDCLFADSDGVGVYDVGSNSRFDACSFTGRVGLSLNDGSQAALARCRFAGNYYSGLSMSGDSHATLSGCSFTGNCRAIDGASVSCTDCVFTGNRSDGSGGAVQLVGDGIFIRCSFRDNQADVGGAIRCISPVPISLRENRADAGGAILGARLVLKDCSFIGNSARWAGAVECSEAQIDGCLFIGNQCDDGVGALSVMGRASLTNCTISGNRWVNPAYGAVYLGRAEGFLTNCIIKDNPCLHSQYGSLPLDTQYLYFAEAKLGADMKVCYSRLESVPDWLDGPGLTDIDPCFANPGYWDPNGTPDDLSDDFWVDGDYHLKSQAGRWDPNSESWVVDDVTSPCIDAGDPNGPVGDEPEPNGGRINMGAYGGTGEASMSEVPGPG